MVAAGTTPEGAAKMRKMRRREGFTLLKLGVVLAILGILLFLMIPRFLNNDGSSMRLAPLGDVVR